MTNDIDNSERNQAFREALACCEAERWNTAQLLSCPPQSAAAHDIGNAIRLLMNTAPVVDERNEDEDHLKDCPFCGHQDDESYKVTFTSTRDVKDGFDYYYSICCPACGIFVEAEYESEVLEKWNTRK